MDCDGKNKFCINACREPFVEWSLLIFSLFIATCVSLSLTYLINYFFHLDVQLMRQESDDGENYETGKK